MRQGLVHDRWLMLDSGYARSPVLAVDAGSTCYVAWISAERGEVVKLSFLGKDGAWSVPRACSEPAPYVTGLSMAPYRDGVMVAWIDGGSAAAGLKMAAISRQDIAEPRLILDAASAPAHPVIVSNQNRLWVIATTRAAGFRQAQIAAGGDIHTLGPWQRLSPDGVMATHPAAAVGPEGVAVVWQEIARRRNRIRHCVLDEQCQRRHETLLVEDSEAMAANPAVCADGSGWWTAWHWDRDPALGPGLVRSVSVARVRDGGQAFVPEAAVPGVERAGVGEDQGFEFPRLAAMDGQLHVFGLGSQSIRRLTLDSEGWGRSVQIDEPGWSCRGPNYSIAMDRETILLAIREREGVSVRTLPLASGGSRPPRLLPRRAQGWSFAILPAAADPAPPDGPLREKKNLILAGYRVLFGDIHQHTAASDGTGTAEETYYRARVRYGDEVVAVADHESFLGKQTPRGEWQSALRIADEFYEPKRFVTLSAYEWTGKMHPGPGHKVVYLPPSGGPLFSRGDIKTGTSSGLLQACWGIGALAVPHHVGWTGADMAAHRPDVQTCFEIVSCHGAYERSDFDVIGTRGDDKEGQFVADALDNNLRFGFTGGSDGHGLSWHHGVSRIQDSHRTGLTAFLCHDVTRESVFDALRRRRCYATSGAKIGLWFEVDGRPMGEELKTGTPLPFRVLAKATAPIVSVCLVSNGGEERPLSHAPLAVDARGTLPSPLKSSFSYYFVRLTQDDDHVAWSSPIWLDPLDSA